IDKEFLQVCSDIDLYYNSSSTSVSSYGKNGAYAETFWTLRGFSDTFYLYPENQNVIWSSPTEKGVVGVMTNKNLDTPPGKEAYSKAGIMAITESGEWTVEYSTGYSGSELEIYEILPEPITFQKQDSDGNPIADAEFIIANSQDDGTFKYYSGYEEDIDKIDWTTDEAQASRLKTDPAGQITGVDLDTGSYFLIETSTPEGYAPIVVPFRQTLYGSLTCNSTYLVSINGSTMTIKDPPAVGLDVSKVSSKDESVMLPDAKFILSQSYGKFNFYLANDGSWTNDRSKAEEFETGADGRISIDNLGEGSYILTEISAPANYKPLSGPVSLDISANVSGNITTYTLSSDKTGGDEVVITKASVAENDIQSASLEMTLKDSPFGIMIAKQDKETHVPLANAAFTLSYEDKGSTYYYAGNGQWTSDGTGIQLTTNDNGQVEAYGLTTGKSYSLTEVVAPDGYALAPAAINFYMGDDGKPVISNTYAMAIDFGEADAEHVTVYDDLIPTFDVEVFKTDSANETLELTGASFILSRDSDGYYLSNGEWVESADNATTFTTDSHGLTTFSKLEEGSYTLTEKNAPAGYEALTSAIKFSLSVDEGLKLEQSDFAKVSADVPYRIMVTNTAVHQTFNVSLSKADKSVPDFKLPGAQFLLLRHADGLYFTDSGWSDSRENAHIYITNTLGRVELGRLEEGTYDLMEITPPSGYQQLSQSITFEVTGTGDVNVEESAYASAEGSEVTVYNDVVEVPAKPSQTPGNGNSSSTTKPSTPSNEPIIDTGDNPTIDTDDDPVIVPDDEPAIEPDDGIIAEPGTDDEETVEPPESDPILKSDDETSGNDEAIELAPEPAGQEFGMAIVKVDAQDQGKVLPGAEFIIAKMQDGQVVFLGSDGTWTTSVAEAARFTTNDYGLAFVERIDPGSYYLYELIAPDGYDALGKPLVFDISDDGTISEQSDMAEASSGEGGLILTVANNQKSVDEGAAVAPADPTDTETPGAITDAGAQDSTLSENASSETSDAKPSSSLPTVKPSNKTNPSKLPQTGQLIWPIPLLILCGAAFIAGAVMLRKKNAAYSSHVHGRHRK
ncbi:MAG: hypothetical protein LUB61_02845, partial [Eggerthellaceae bacterium]|nr:hypothetical protein [Eggerthellaceae bacterium]